MPNNVLNCIINHEKLPSIFSKIVNGDIPCHKIAETADFLAFLDVNPCAVGHTLVIPKQEIDYIFNLPTELYAGLMAFAKDLVPAIEAAVPCKRVGVAIIGLEVPHAHIHLIPLNSMADMDFSSKLSPSQDELAKTATKIRQVFSHKKVLIQ